jgi:hypothetical protein
MKLSLETLYINPEKLRSYLLNIHHIDGSSKAKLLLSFGFNINDIAQLHNEIISHAIINEASKVIVTEYGRKYTIEGLIQTPSGRAVMIRSIWLQEIQEEIIKFVTLYPI